MKLLVKSDVALSGISKEIVRIIPLVMDEYETLNQDLMITSGLEGVHLAHSRHYDGDALDFKTHGVLRQDLVKIRNDLIFNLGSQYTVLIEDLGLPNEHMHIQYNRIR